MEYGKNVAMQVAAMKPIAIDKTDVPQEVIDKEIEIGKELARNEGKPEAMLETVTITMNVEKTLRLTFDSRRELQAAAISVDLPPGVEIVGYEGRDSVRWRTTIKAGTNILELPLIVRSGNGGAVLARLQHEGKQKTFEFAVEVI